MQAAAELSTDAQHLLAYLSRWATGPALAATDNDLSRLLGIPKRRLIDLADELLAAGHMAVASCQAPKGRWLLQADAPPDHWQQARAYIDSLGNRARHVFVRRRHARSALAQMEARRHVESDGQRRLF